MKYSSLERQALGLDASELCEWWQDGKQFFVHKGIVEPLTSLQEDAKKSGFNLQIVSAYRDFHRQLSIWNAKASGKRILMDSRGSILPFDQLTNEQKLFAILRWSAIPGLSRHHWGTDIDIYDANKIALQDVQLIPPEVEANGPCAEMHQWLTERIFTNNSKGFYRPYQHDKGGIAPEMWHLSYLPQAKIYTRVLNIDTMLAVWGENPMLLMEELMSNLTEIWPVYVDLSNNFQPEWVVDMQVG